MNWNQGLKRISAVFWSFWGLILLAMVGVLFNEGNYRDSALTLVGGIGIYGCHWVTCWVIDGFFRKQT